jgi:hypothetical protein
MTRCSYGMSFPVLNLTTNLGLTPPYRRVPYLSQVSVLATKLSEWKEQRLPPPRVSQSAVGLLSSSGAGTEAKGIV